MDVCCPTMKFHSRRYFPNVPEAEQPDAIIEFHADRGDWLLWQPQTASYFQQINYCPWCGTELATLAP
jgi:hypothetical protein